jgi:hypothetical protein
MQHHKGDRSAHPHGGIGSARDAEERADAKEIGEHEVVHQAGIDEHAGE